MDFGPKRRACVRCRNNKTRCLIDDNYPDICQRCMRLGHPCVFAPVAKREPRKATHTRVEELEKNINALHSLLREKEAAASANTTEFVATSPANQRLNDMCEVTSVTEEREEPVPNKNQSHSLHDSNRTSVWSQAAITSATHNQYDGEPAYHKNITMLERPDVIDDKLLSMQMAHQLLRRYKTDLYIQYPVVYIPFTYSAEELRRTKPMLFLAILGAAAGKEDPDLAVKLDRRALEEYAVRCMINSEKSFELVQSLLINAIWFQPSQRLNQLKFNDYIRMAATMAMDIGIGVTRSKLTSSKTPTEIEGQSSHPLGNQHLEPDISIHNLATNAVITSIEARRALLGIYISSANISITLRRPAIISANSQVRECMNLLEQSAQALPNDKKLVAWTRLLMISDDIGIALSYNDLYSVASVLDVKTQLMLSAFEEKLTSWRSSHFHSDLSGSLGISYFTVRMCLFEVVLYLDFPAEDFKAPFQMSPVSPQAVAELPMKPIADAATQLLQSIHDLLDLFLEMRLESTRTWPVFCYIRVCSAIIILAKLSMICASKDSTLRGVINRLDIKMEHYMNLVLSRLREIIGSNTCRVPAIFIPLLLYVRRRCNQAEQPDRSEARQFSRELEHLLPGIIADSRAIPSDDTNAGRTAESREHMPATVEDSQGSPWSVSVDDMNWRGNVLSFPGDGVPLGHNDENTWMSCPTQ